MKKVISLLLAVMMAFSIVAVGAVSASAAEDVAFEAGSKMFFDNTNTQWDNIYFYAWSNGYYGDFVPMQPVEGEENLYSLVVPQAVPNGDSYFLFTNSTDWTGSQTDNQSATAGYNTYTPSADAKAVVKSYTEYEVVPEVAITPYSKTFTGTIDVTVYAFNLEEGQTAEYTINGAPYDLEGSETVTLDESATVTVEIYNEDFDVVASTSCDFTKAEDAVITVNAGDYDGDMYVYTYGGDRLGADFNLMENLGEGQYKYTLNGSAHVIFTTTDDWATAVKFLILNEDGSLASDQEPLVNFGEKVTFTVKLP